MPRTIIHLDLDAFYASVEQLDDPSLRGKAVIVGGTSDRGVVCAASYEARRHGVRSAMPTARARRLCPGGVFVRPRFERYAELSRRVFAIYRRTTPLVEPLSLDEAFLDVTRSRALLGEAPAVAESVRRAVREETGLTVSAGVADCKMAAKIASDLGKPAGVVVDTHVRRVAARLGFTASDDPVVIEQDLMKVIPQNKWIDFSSGVVVTNARLNWEQAQKVAQMGQNGLARTIRQHPWFDEVTAPFRPLRRAA